MRDRLPLFNQLRSPALRERYGALRRGGDGAQIGLIVVASGDFLPLGTRLIQSAFKHFLHSHRLVPFLFSDGLLSGRVSFPGVTLYRYHFFLEQERLLERMDYLFYCDADMLMVDAIGDEILGRIVAVHHPGYVGLRGPYEENPRSTAYVSPEEGEAYFCGGFQGGEARAYLEAAATLASRIDKDDHDGRMAVWHDESQWNRYLIDHPPEVKLSPAYAYPETNRSHYTVLWGRDYSPKIVALDKARGRFRAQRL